MLNVSKKRSEKPKQTSRSGKRSCDDPEIHLVLLLEALLDAQDKKQQAYQTLFEQTNQTVYNSALLDYSANQVRNDRST